jgi:1-acyl-sn-glycerol-3-phosphate acyltransferase
MPRTEFRSPSVIRLVVALFEPLRLVHRMRFEGLDKIPEHRPVLLVANHSIGAALEVFGILSAWRKRFGDRPAHGLAHRLAFRVPGVAHVMRAIGAVPADFAEAKRALDSGASLLVFPGGNWEATRSFRRGNQVDFDGHRGWIEVAKNSGVEIVPVSISGSYRVNPVLGRSERLARILGFRAALRVRWLPVTAGQFVWTALFLLFALGSAPTVLVLLAAPYVFAFTPLFPIWPARITVRFGDPIPSDGDADALDRDVRALIAARLD